MRQQLKDFIIAFDFDGTIVENAWPEVGSPRKDIIDAIRYLHSLGMLIVIWTCREDEPKEKAIKFLNDNAIPFDAINDNLKYRQEMYGNNTRKIGADLYVDDKDPRGVPTKFEIITAATVEYSKKLRNGECHENIVL